MSYIAKYKITDGKLGQQFVDASSLSLSPDGYESWLRQRVQRLADAGNEFLVELAHTPPR